VMARRHRKRQVDVRRATLLLGGSETLLEGNGHSAEACVLCLLGEFIIFTDRPRVHHIYQIHSTNVQIAGSLMLRNTALVPDIQSAYAAVLLAENVAISHLHFWLLRVLYGWPRRQLDMGCFLLTLAASTFGGFEKMNVVDRSYSFSTVQMLLTTKESSFVMIARRSEVA